MGRELDKDVGACELLSEEFYETDILRSGAIQFYRPNFSQLIEDKIIQ